MSRLRKATNKILRDDPNDNQIPDGPIDEQEQERLIAAFELEALKQQENFRIAFTTMILFSSPLYIFLPYCRYNPLLSLMALVSTILSAYSVYYLPISSLSLLSKWLPTATVLLSFVVGLNGYIKHAPWRGYDYIWSLPIISAMSAIVYRSLNAQTDEEIESLRGAQYKLKGA